MAVQYITKVSDTNGAGMQTAIYYSFVCSHIQLQLQLGIMHLLIWDLVQVAVNYFVLEMDQF